MMDSHLIETSRRLAWFATGGVLFGVIGWIGGQWQGQRDAEALARLDRVAEFARCAEGELPILLLRDAARPERDLWACTGGSLRRAGK